MPIIKQADLTALTQGINDLVARVETLETTVTPAVVNPTPVSQDTEYVDPVAQELDNTEILLIKQLANPHYKTVKGRQGGAVVIDVTADAMGQLMDLRQNRKKWRTQTKIR